MTPYKYDALCAKENANYYKHDINRHVKAWFTFDADVKCQLAFFQIFSLPKSFF